MYSMFDDEHLFLDPVLFGEAMPSYKQIQGRTISLKESTAFYKGNNQWEKGGSLQEGMHRYGLNCCPAVLALFTHLGASVVDVPTKDGTRCSQRAVPRFPCQPPLNCRPINKERNLFVDHPDKRNMIAVAPDAGLFFTAAGCNPTKNLGSHPFHAVMYSVHFNTDEEVSSISRVDRFKKPRGFSSDVLHGICQVGPAVSSGTGEEDSLMVDSYAALSKSKEIEDLYYLLLGQKFWEVHSVNLEETEQWNHAPEPHKAMIMFSELLCDFEREYNHFASVKDWVKFFLRHENQHPLSQRPNDCPDLFYRVYVIVNSLSPVRLAFLEGLGRIGATLYSLFRKQPPLDVETLLAISRQSVYMSNLKHPPNLQAASHAVSTTLISPHGIPDGGRSVNPGAAGAERLFLSDAQPAEMRGCSAGTQRQGCDADAISIAQSIQGFFQVMQVNGVDLPPLAESIPLNQLKNPNEPETNSTRLKQWLHYTLRWIYEQADHGSMHTLVEATFLERTVATHLDDRPEGSQGHSIRQLIQIGKHPDLLEHNFTKVIDACFKDSQFRNGWKPNETKNMGTLLSLLCFPLVGLKSQIQTSASTMLELLRVFDGSKVFKLTKELCGPDGRQSYDPDYSKQTILLGHEDCLEVDVSVILPCCPSCCLNSQNQIEITFHIDYQLNVTLQIKLKFHFISIAN